MNKEFRQIGNTPLSISIYSVEKTPTHIHDRGYLEIIFCLQGSVRFAYGYEEFKKDVYKLTDINLDMYKERQMKRRIDTLIGKHGYTEYGEFVKALKVSKELLNEFVNYLTINVSEFYRNPEQWKYLEERVIPDLIHKFGHGIKIWSAACSTGDEPYSLVMLLSKFLPLSQIKILATDIDEQVIAKAKIGLYKSISLNSLPQEFKDKYFKLEPDKPCKTITAHMKFDCNMYIHPFQARGLTPREAARIQSYPDDYYFRGSYTKTYMQVGNSVPPLLGTIIADAIKRSIEEG